MIRTSAVVFTVLCFAGCLATAGQQASPPAHQGAKQQPDSKPDFSGTWALQPDRSSLEIQVPESSVFTIDHQDPHWRLERTHVFDGRANTLVLDLLTDGVPVVREVGGVEIHSRLYWEGDTLVLESVDTLNGEEFNNVVRYRLADEGRTFIADERQVIKQKSHRNIWVFERQ